MAEKLHFYNEGLDFFLVDPVRKTTTKFGVAFPEPGTVIQHDVYLEEFGEEKRQLVGHFNHNEGEAQYRLYQKLHDLIADHIIEKFKGSEIDDTTSYHNAFPKKPFRLAI